MLPFPTCWRITLLHKSISGRGSAGIENEICKTIFKTTFYHCKLTIQSSEIFEGNLAMTPDGRNNGINLLPLQSPVSNSKELVLHNKGKSSLVHVNHNCM